jgi:hypothetical protein
MPMDQGEGLLAERFQRCPTAADSYTQIWAGIRGCLDGLNPEQLRAVLGGTARRVYGLPAGHRSGAMPAGRRVLDLVLGSKRASRRARPGTTRKFMAGTSPPEAAGDA